MNMSEMDQVINLTMAYLGGQEFVDLVNMQYPVVITPLGDTVEMTIGWNKKSLNNYNAMRIVCTSADEYVVSFGYRDASVDMNESHFDFRSTTTELLALDLIPLFREKTGINGIQELDFKWVEMKDESGRVIGTQMVLIKKSK